MDYNQISNFLDKFKKLIYQKEEINEIIIKTISDEISHPIEKNSLKIKGGCIYIQGSPILRNEILMHKNNILTKLNILIPSIKFFEIK